MFRLLKESNSFYAAVRVSDIIINYLRRNDNDIEKQHDPRQRRSTIFSR
jgi:hypothetical protein